MDFDVKQSELKHAITLALRLKEHRVGRADLRPRAKGLHDQDDPGAPGEAGRPDYEAPVDEARRHSRGQQALEDGDPHALEPAAFGSA